MAENRRICDPDEAVGYRAQIGREQWLVYRSLAPRGNRTILGQNLIYEFVAGRLQPDGSLTEFIEIEWSGTFATHELDHRPTHREQPTGGSPADQECRRGRDVIPAM